jgi:hypothetical protein
MFGNRLGWMISAGIVVATVALLAGMVVIAGSTTPPTPAFANDPANFAPLSLPTSPASLVTPGTDAGDPADLYNQAIAEYDNDPTPYEQFLKTNKMPSTAPAALAFLLKARSLQPAKIFASEPQVVVNYKGEKPKLETLRKLGHVAINYGMMINRQRKGEGLRYQEAAFVLGQALYDERLVYAEYQAGIDLMSTASAAMPSVLDAKHDADRITAAKAFGSSIKDYQAQHVTPIEMFLSSIDQTILETHAGDVMLMEQKGTERMWRVEAIFALGRYRYNAGLKGDQLAAAREVRKLANDPDPVLSTAGTAARDLTLEQYNMLH